MVDFSQIFSSLSWHDGIQLVTPIVTFIFGIIVYCLFIHMFHKFIARRDFFGASGKYEHMMERYRKSKTIIAIQYLLFFPLLVFFWFAVFFILLTFLSKNKTIDEMMIIAVAVISMIRVMSYMMKDLARDLARLLPFALLSVFVFDIGKFSIGSAFDLITTATSDPTFWVKLTYYLVFIMGLEFTMRILYTIGSSFKSHKTRMARKEVTWESYLEREKRKNKKSTS